MYSFNILPAKQPGRYWFTVSKNGIIIYDSRQTRKGKRIGKSYSYFDAYMRAWGKRNKLEKENQ